MQEPAITTRRTDRVEAINRALGHVSFAEAQIQRLCIDAASNGELGVVAPALCFVEQGQCWIEDERYPDNASESEQHPGLLATGDLIVCVRGSMPRLLLRTQSSPPGATVVVGTLRFSGDLETLLRTHLPATLVVRRSTGAEQVWLHETMRMAVAETESSVPGASALIGHLMQTVLAYALRVHLASLPTNSKNLFAALMHPQIGRVLNSLHARLDARWTIAGLAKEAGMSRSACAEKFLALVGIAPMRYLLECRMRKAQQLLRETESGLKDIASQLGYASEPAFSRAFKRWCGQAPGMVRSKSLASYHGVDTAIEG
jgi:AraC-like DNA-binding protein